jgi:aryl-alcohol dehydrogenase-like predicted oxidoreductase
MEHRILGGTGMSVSTYCFGAMMLGEWGNPDTDECGRMLHRALDAGINFIDTADVYSDGRSEEIVGRALKGRRDSVVLATKFHHPMGTEPNRRGNSRRWIMQAIDGSLRRLDTDWIDLYQVHRPDQAADIDEILGALSDLVRDGRVRTIGTSTFPAEQIVEAQWVSARRGRERFATEQPPYSVFVRGGETSVLPACERYGIGVLAWSPLNGGWLTGKYRHDVAPPSDSRAAREPDHFDYGSSIRERKLDLIVQLATVAADAGCSLTHLAHAFVLAHPAVTSAIIGPRTVEQLEDVLSGVELRLDSEVLDRIDAIVPPGVDVNSADRQYQAPEMLDASLRRL